MRPRSGVGIGKRVRSEREALALTQEALARELGVTHQHVSRIEAGQVAPSLELVVKLSSRLGVTTDYLLCGNDCPFTDLVGAIRSDRGLSAQAKKHLIGLIAELKR
jgi:transcriptional regulator with XRE-family HTH domain